MCLPSFLKSPEVSHHDFFFDFMFLTKFSIWVEMVSRQRGLPCLVGTDGCFHGAALTGEAYPCPPIAGSE